MTDRRVLGRAAETLAREYLMEHGLEPIEANWHRRVGEIDLIMREPDDGTIVFVEVRYRTDAVHGGALASVDHAKRRRLRRAALAWLQQAGDCDAPARIDVVAIEPASTSSPHADDTNGTPPDETCPRHIDGRRSAGRRSARPERLVARRGDHVVRWVVNAVEDAD